MRNCVPPSTLVKRVGYGSHLSHPLHQSCFWSSFWGGGAPDRRETGGCGVMRAASPGTRAPSGRSAAWSCKSCGRPGPPGPRKPAGSAQSCTARGAAASTPSAGLGPGVRPARETGPGLRSGRATPARAASGGAGPRRGARSPETRAGTRTPAAAAPCEGVRVRAASNLPPYLSAGEESGPWLQHPGATALAQHRLPVSALG